MKYRLLKGYKYQVAETIAVDTTIIGYHVDTKYFALLEDGRLFAREGYCWDGASGPAFDTKTIMRGTLFHDALYQLMREGHILRHYRKKADLLLKGICLEDGMWKVRANWVYWAVQTFAKREVFPRKNPRGKIVTI